MLDSGQHPMRYIMVSFPPCKINLGLKILAKRPDGYHDIATCFYPLPITDILEIIPANEHHFDQTGVAIPGNQKDNLCWKAYELLKADFPLTAVHMHLHKMIPTGAGLGGGSSDASHTIRILNGIFSLKLSEAQQMGYAQRLGSDCAFFIQDGPMLGTGRGEVLKKLPITLKGLHFVLVNPPIHISTAEAFRNVSPAQSTIPIERVLEKPLRCWKEELGNDFEESIFYKYPAIRKLKDTLYSLGAVYACMSGSGSSVFGLFEHAIDPLPHFKDVWCRSGQL